MTTFNICDDIKKSSIPPTDVENRFFDVVIHQIDSPNEFFIQSKANISEFKILCNNINNFYKSLKLPKEYRIRSTYGLIGTFVAALIEKGDWHRAEVKDVIDCQVLIVKYIDHGALSEIHISQLRYLDKAFSSLPQQATKSSLAGIGDVSTSGRILFNQMVSEAMKKDSPGLVATIMKKLDSRINFDDIVPLCLYDTLKSPIVIINQVLLDQGERMDPSFEIDGKIPWPIMEQKSSKITAGSTSSISIDGSKVRTSVQMKKFET